MTPLALPNHGPRISAFVGIEETAASHLRTSPYLALRDIGCSYRDGVLTLRGCVATYYLKQLAQTLVGDLEGVRAVINRIEVLAPSRRG
jgi:osmotically-inducible protein OsmY